ncbi:cytochrome P450 [Pilaira anomala]|nr:cytochrome P450 [Pilaira anomala]
MAETISLIVALKNCENIEVDGKIIRIGNGANTNTVRSLAAEKLGLTIPLNDIILETSTGDELTEIEKVKLQQVVFINFQQQIKEIPGPVRLPMVGNLYDMMPDLCAGWAKQFSAYGNVASVSIFGTELVATNDPAIAEIFCKESEYFTKKITNTLKEIKDFAGNGLFTSDSDDDEWKLAHKILMPAFSPRAIKAYQPEMGIIAQETIKIFSEYTPEDKVEILDWCTNMTFETIGRIGFGYTFDLMHRDKPPHPFIVAMGYGLSNSVVRFSRPAFMRHLPIASNRKWERGNDLMRSLVDQVIVERKNSEFAKDSEKDLLGFMLNARDEHNLGLSDENIRDQVITFLIAGHDTTANTLAWVLYELSRNPDVQTKLLQEIANAGISSDKLPTVEQISSLKYFSRVLKETLRMHSPLRGIGKYCKKECILPGGYRIKAGVAAVASTLNIHMNPEVYKNPTKFDPDRWTPEEEQKRSLYAWLPFSTGPRACIGMAFALQELKTALGMFLHRFEFKYDGPDVDYDPYQPTTKPLDMFMTIHPRTNFPEPNESIVHETRQEESEEKIGMPVLDQTISGAGTIELPKATFLFGTQTGTAQDYASQMASQAKRFGFKEVRLCSMDEWEVIKTGKYQNLKDTQTRNNELIVICTATYNGQPPESSEAFNKFLDASLEEGNEDLLEGINYAVFGLGNKNWRTYQAFPLKVDTNLDKLGAHRFFSPGEGDADKDMDGDFNQWCAYFWTHVLGKYGVAASASKSVIPTATLSAEDTDLSTAKVSFISPTEDAKCKSALENKNGEYNAELIVNRELQKEGSDRSTRHIEIEISQLESVSSIKDHLYEAGDHIEIMPENDVKEAERIALGFGLVLDSVFEIDAESVTGLSPRSMAASIKGPCTVRNALVYYADLMSPPSRRMLSFFAAQLHATAPETAKKFDSLTMPDENNQDQYPAFIKKYRTLLDLQLAFPQVKRIDLGQFLTAVGVMQPRRYSIASSPLVFPKHAHIAVGIVDDIVGDKHYPGLASSYLNRLQNKSRVRAQLKSSKSTFSMPEDITKPLVMIAAGTGISPFRGFIQERAFQKKNGQQVGPCILFFGCRNPEKDYIYSDELEEYINAGVLINKHIAFSRLNPPTTQKYVQHAVLANAGEVWSLLFNKNGSNGAIYICGSGAMSRDVCSTFQVISKSFGVAQNDDEADQFLQKLIDEKSLFQDVWG